MLPPWEMLDSLTSIKVVCRWWCVCVWWSEWCVYVTCGGSVYVCVSAWYVGGCIVCGVFVCVVYM